MVAAAKPDPQRAEMALRIIATQIQKGDYQKAFKNSVMVAMQFQTIPLGKAPFRAPVVMFCEEGYAHMFARVERQVEIYSAVGESGEGVKSRGVDVRFLWTEKKDAEWPSEVFQLDCEVPVIIVRW